MTGSVASLALAALAFVGLHFLLSGPLRAPLIRLVGERVFPGIYSLVALVTFVWMILAYGHAPYIELWGKAEWFRWPLIILMLPAAILVVAGLTPANPALFNPAGPSQPAAGPRGILAITRHPMNWGFGIWGLGHAIMNGDLATVILGGAIAILAFGGSLAQETRKTREGGEAWRRYAAATSFIPFLAIAQGRARFSLREIGYGQLAGGILLWALLLHFHRYITGGSPLPM